ncbi:YcaO-like family protein [Bacillus sp. DX1.1]|uniref:YcaO-like family protein n=1 Tax=unclassified Bacillus (in: firmicutes) TaxID=185979 RepID=UPI0025702D73|nr:MULTISPECIES: YcaO-like family protein [unclassified Bacillus (in: firmicutes)]MDM5152690.1 YcaO-like family protein [Bacillus sp. DX1.1]MDM5152714.1 YcaO-like family protein [Bacillus sp. DX1.1]WJE84389.1 YcaO-like family protein [Bacillus sp. DX3.1]WJE84411.1 YcaO-like family protein [Bacillus sp. DX3.1]
MLYSWERETLEEIAHQRIMDTFKELSFSVKKRAFGDKIQTTYVELFNLNQQIESFGVGKGKYNELGALFEALEHYTLENMPMKECDYFSSHHIAKNPIFNGERVMQLIVEEPDQQLLCKKYYALNNTQQHVWYPFFIANPHYMQHPIETDTYQYQKVQRYSSNSGTAIGSTLHEAIIHATNEVIERDAFSLFLLRHFYYDMPDHTLNIIHPNTLPSSLKETIVHAEEELQEEIILLNITTEVAIPTILAVTKNKKHTGIFGLGTSLYPEYAILRSITELVQVNHIASANIGDELAHREHFLNQLQPYPRHYACAEMNMCSVFNQFPATYVSFEDFPRFSERNLILYIEEMQERLHQQHFSIYYSPVKEFSNGIKIIHVLIPQMERFLLITNGQLVFPSERGMKKNLKLQSSL